MKAIIQILTDRGLREAVVNTGLRTIAKAFRKVTGYLSVLREIVIEDLLHRPALILTDQGSIKDLHTRKTHDGHHHSSGKTPSSMPAKKI